MCLAADPVLFTASVGLLGCVNAKVCFQDRLMCTCTYLHTGCVQLQLAAAKRNPVLRPSLFRPSCPTFRNAFQASRIVGCCICAVVAALPALTGSFAVGMEAWFSGGHSLGLGSGVQRPASTGNPASQAFVMVWDAKHPGRNHQLQRRYGKQLEPLAALA